MEVGIVRNESDTTVFINFIDNDDFTIIHFHLKKCHSYIENEYSLYISSSQSVCSIDPDIIKNLLNLGL